MMILGCLGKFGALFVTIPDPVIGGLFMVTFGMSAKSAPTNMCTCLGIVKHTLLTTYALFSSHFEKFLTT